jgi:hypothetical protein
VAHSHTCRVLIGVGLCRRLHIRIGGEVLRQARLQRGFAAGLSGGRRHGERTRWTSAGTWRSTRAAVRPPEGAGEDTLGHPRRPLRHGEPDRPAGRGRLMCRSSKTGSPERLVALAAARDLLLRANDLFVRANPSYLHTPGRGGMSCSIRVAEGLRDGAVGTEDVKSQARPRPPPHPTTHPGLSGRPSPGPRLDPSRCAGPSVGSKCPTQV